MLHLPALGGICPCWHLFQEKVWKIPMGNMSVAPFDAILLMSFGGPEKPADVLPFLQNVTRGRGIPDERLEEVGEHYYMFGGKSPINEQNQALVRALRDEFAARGIDTPLLWGNRNWQPYLAEVVGNHARMHGSRRFLAIDTSAYSSYSSCRQYREDFAGAVAALEEQGIEVVIDKVRQYYNHPGFAQAQLDCLRRGLGEFKQLVGGLDRSRHKILFVTHSIPTSMQKSSEKFTVGYQGQHEELMKWLSEIGRASCRERV